MENREDTFNDEPYEDDLSDVPDDSDVDIDMESDSDLSSFITSHATRVMHLSSSDEESDAEDISTDWTDNDIPRNNNDFEGDPGVKVLPEDVTNVEDVAGLFIGDDLFSIIATETNKYRSNNQHKYKVISHTPIWIDVTVKELKKWFALGIIMGLVRKGVLNDYWSLNKLIETPIFGKTMSRNRFKDILKFLHFNDNEEVPHNTNRLVKVEKIVKYFLKKFNEVYKPKQNLSLDEGMIPWRGQLNLRVYNPMKVTKYGILNRMVCEADTGYICNFKLYTADGSNLLSTVMSVLKNNLDMWHYIYADNFYNSINLATELLSRKTRICGTIRQNRGITESLKNVRLLIFETKFHRRVEILIQLWKTVKKRDVRMISNIHNAELVDIGRNDWKTGIPIK